MNSQLSVVRCSLFNVRYQLQRCVFAVRGRFLGRFRLTVLQLADSTAARFFN